MSTAFRQVAAGVWSVTAGEISANSYICSADLPGGAVLVDVGLNAQPIEDALHALGLRPAALFCTHGHFDHIGSAAFFQDKYGIPVYLHEADIKTASANNFLLTMFGLSARIQTPEISPVLDGFTLMLGDETLSYRHLPGHTPGSCFISLGNNLFTGDTLFSNGVGLSRLPGQKNELLRKSLIEVWPHLDPYDIHPGHGRSGRGALIKEDNVALRAFLHFDDSNDRPQAETSAG